MTNIGRTGESCFERYIVEKDYSIRTTSADGSEIHITDKNEIEKLLTSDFFSGSIAFSRDTAHKGWLHRLVYMIQAAAAFLSGRQKKLDSNLCHGMVIIDAGKKSDALPYPFLITHSVFEGIRTANRDYLRAPDVTQLVIYRPVLESVRNNVKTFALRTAYVEKKEFRTEQSPKRKPKFSVLDLATSILFQKRHKHRVRLHKTPMPRRTMERTGYLVADVLLGNQILNRRNKPKALFCSAYATYVLQGGLFLDQMSFFSDDDKNNFVGTLSREQLAKKIVSVFKGEGDDPFSRSLRKLYLENKIARYDARHSVSSNIARTLNKRIKVAL
jgi:hypothetical protein